MNWMLWLLLVLCTLFLAALGVSAFGARRWANAAQSLTAKLEAGRIDAPPQPSAPSRYDARELDSLPAPVQRYFRKVLKDGQPIIIAATVNLAGTINLSATGEQWKPFTSTQRVVTLRPGFLWNAQVAMLPGVPVRVVDSYIGGQGLVHAAMLGLLTVADVSGGGEIARGEFMRYFAEAAWYPTALLPSQGVAWAAVDDRCANTTMVDGPLVLTLLFRFNDASLIESVRAQARGAGVGKDMVMLPWECGLSNYVVDSGMTVPMTGQAAWVRSGAPKAYFIGNVTSLTYEFAR